MNLLERKLLGTILLFVVGYAEASVAQLERTPEQVESGRPDNEDREIVDVQTKADLQSILSEMRRNLLPSHCGEWKENDVRVIAVMNLQGLKELWIGKEYSDSEGLGIKGLRKAYEIKSFSKGGSPLRGSIKIRLPTPEMNVERACFSRLKGAQIRGAIDNGQGGYHGDHWKMTISEISFGVLVKPHRIWGQKAATGATQVTLTISEGLMAMALRKSAEHLWALPGSLGLMMLWAVGGRILSRIRAKRRLRLKSGPRARPTHPR